MSLWNNLMFFPVIRNSSNKRRIRGAVLIRKRCLLTFLSQVQRFFEGGAYSSKYGKLLTISSVVTVTVLNNSSTYARHSPSGCILDCHKNVRPISCCRKYFPVFIFSFNHNPYPFRNSSLVYDMYVLF